MPKLSSTRCDKRKPGKKISSYFKSWKKQEAKIRSKNKRELQYDVQTS